MSGRQTLDVFISTGPPAEDLAREAWLLDRAAEGRVSVAVASWRGPVVVLGYAQRTDDVDLEWCRNARLPVLRRLTGGTGVVHRGDVGVSLALPIDHAWAKGIIGLYGRFLDVLEPALRGLGSEVGRLAEPAHASRVRSPICFLDQLADTLAVGGKKAVGCAQTRRRGAALIHAAILLGLDAEIYARVFGMEANDVESGLTAALPDADWRQVGDAIAEGLAQALELDVRRRPLEPVPDRYLEPYSTPRWAPLGV